MCRITPLLSPPCSLMLQSSYYSLYRYIILKVGYSTALSKINIHDHDKSDFWFHLNEKSSNSCKFAACNMIF